MQTLSRSPSLAAPPSDGGVWHFCGTIDAAGCDSNGRTAMPSGKRCDNGHEPCSNAAAATATHRVDFPDGYEDADGSPCMARNVSVDGMECRPCDPGNLENDEFDAVHPPHQQPPPLGGENDDPTCGECNDEYAEEEDEDGFESDSEENDGQSESDEEDSEVEDSDAEDEGNHQHTYPWGQEYETDEDGSDDSDDGEDEAEDGRQLCGFLNSPGGRSYDSDGSSSYAGASRGKRRRSPGDHELFLPANMSPSVESLKYDSDDDDESDDGNAYGFGGAGYGRRGGRAYMLGPPPRRPRLWDGCPQITSVSSGSSSDSSDEESTTSSTAGKRRRDSPPSAKRRGVTFNPSVVVNHIFATEAYPPSMLETMYTPRDELRRAKLRNKKEYTYDSSDWRNATEEWAMERDETSGELIHPANLDVPPRGAGGAAAVGSRVAVVRNAVRTRVLTYSSAGGYADETVDESGDVFDDSLDNGHDDDEEAGEAAVEDYDEEGDEEMRHVEDGGDGSALGVGDSSSSTTVVHTAKRMRMCWS